MILATGTPALWYLTRGTGAVTLAGLTLSVVLGIAEVQRLSLPGAPRFMVASLHRTASLLVLALLVVHVATAVLDAFAPIRLLDAVVPFAGVYRPLWLGLGALALDGLLAVIVTSLVRRRLGLRTWRTVHWAAYACWPVAVVHGLGTGSDARAGWMQLLTAACAAAVLAAVAWRLLRSGPVRAGVRAGAAGAVAALGLAMAVWLPQGPLAPGWARRSGTPASLLGFHAASARADSRPAGGGALGPVADPLASGFHGALRGTLDQGLSPSGTTVVDLRLHRRGLVLRLRLGGTAAPGGGLLMRRSAVDVGTPHEAQRYRGRVTRLDGTVLRADVAARDGRALRVDLALDVAGPQVTGTVLARPLRGVPG